MDYNPRDIEQYWRQHWEKEQTYKIKPEDFSRPKYYVLDMFPYPSGAGLHVGHPLGYIASDIYARFKRLKGFNVLHPMGYDAFGLPAEQYAIQTGVHPAKSTDENIARYRAQLNNLGFSFDWSRQVKTCEPDYYRWTQHIFLMLFNHYYNNTKGKAEPIAGLISIFENEGNANVNACTAQENTFTAEEWKGFSAVQRDEVLMNYRLAFRKMGFVNWCEQLGTVLANDEVKDGVSERGGYPVVQKPMMQWTLRITAYAERLLNGLETVDFSEALKTQQRNWIGRSEGARVFFKQSNGEAEIEIFTTRPDTIFGATFMVLAPEHPLVASLTTPEQKGAIDAYLTYAKSRSERERQSETKKVTGAFTGAAVRNPFTGKDIPVWISDYVLVNYGTGAIMAVPGHDERDHRFAEHFNLPIIAVVDQSAHAGAGMEDKVGKMVQSGFLDGMEVTAAIKAILSKIEEMGIGKRQVNFRLRDANFSRQRYWGEPFPIKYAADGTTHEETTLPVVLPDLEDYRPTAEGKAPLARATQWVNTPDGMTRETDTMPGYAGSSWYYLRYMDAQNATEPFSQEAVQYWQDVDLYVGGSEHAVGHLLYSRFWHKFMHDLGLVPTEEPYKKLVNQGMIQGVAEYLYMLKEKENGKSRFVSADLASKYEEDALTQMPIHIDFVKDYGADTSYLDADGIHQFCEWRPDFAEAIFETNSEGKMVTRNEVGKMSKSLYNVVNPDDVVAQYGADCFRLYEMFLGPLEMSKPWDTRNIKGTYRFLQNFWNLYFENGNFSISDEAATKEEFKVLHTVIKKVSEDVERFSFNTCVSAFMIAVNELKRINCRKRAILQPLTLLLAPFAPHMTEELWQRLGGEGSVHHASYPVLDESYLVEDAFNYPICINGKKRAETVFSAVMSDADIKNVIPTMDIVVKLLDGKPIKNVVVVPKRMINIVL